MAQAPDEGPSSSGARKRLREDADATQLPAEAATQHENGRDLDKVNGAVCAPKSKANKAHKKNGSTTDKKRKLPVETPHRLAGRTLGLRDSGAGQIKEVHVTNFMCHANMRVDFTPHVNFISGPNGSGKSAILQALQYCLGVRATQTGRAGSNAQYMKKGCDSCTASVTIWNTGEEGDTFEPEVFGPTITIAKSMNARGATTTKVLNHRGDKMMSKASDVARILDVLAVNAANPSIVLTQDHAKNLLSGEKVNRKLYDLMTEALGFNTTHDLLTQAKTDITSQQSLIEDLKKQKVEFEEKIAAATEALETCKQGEELLDLAGRLEDAMAWAVAKNARARMEEQQHELQVTGPEAMATCQKQLGVLQEDLAKLEAEMAEFEATKQEIQVNIDAHGQTKTGLDARRKEANNVKNAVVRKFKDRKQALADLEDQKAQSEEALRRVQAKSKRTTLDDKLERWQKQCDDTVAQLAASQALEAPTKTDLARATEELEGAMEASRNAKSVRDGNKRQVNELQQELHDLERMSRGGASHPSAVFHPRAPQLLDAVQRNSRKFRKQPVGPVGMHLSIMDETFSATLTGALGGLLSAFAVDNQQDRQLLSQLAKEVGYQGLTIYTTSFALPQHTIPQSAEPRGDFITAKRILQVKPEAPQPAMLMNLLVDHGHIEGLVLCANDKLGDQILRDDALYRNVHTIFCDSGNPRVGPSEKNRKGSSQSTWAWKHAPPQPLLSQDTSTVTAARKQQLEADKAELQKSESDLRAHQAAVRAAEGEVESLKRKLESVFTKNNTLSTKLQKVQRERPEAEDAGEDILAQRYADIADLDNQIQRARPEVAALGEEVSAEAEKVAKVQKEKDAWAEEAKRMGEEMAGQLDFIYNKQRDKAVLRGKVEQLEKQMGKVTEHEGNVRRALEKWTATYERAKADAIESGCSEEEAERERPELKQDMQEHLGDFIAKHMRDVDLDTILDDGQQLSKLSTHLQNRGNRKVQAAGDRSLADLEATVFKLQTEMAEAVKKSEQIMFMVEFERKSWRERVKKFNEIKQLSRDSVSGAFADRLKKGRNWRGKIDVDHEAQHVYLSVAANKGTSEGGNIAMKDLKSLSGGERSFTAVSFVLSLGKEIRTPFFAMDEFDVFMDAVNRRVALTSILRFAWTSPDTQFLLLSPLDMSVVEQSREELNAGLKAEAALQGHKAQLMQPDFVHTYAMKPPREGARAHF